ncbi:MAG: hypothetical protein ABL916_06910 [Burkholderiaceae bacterium]
MTKRISRTVAETPLPLVRRLLGATDETEVLVGGQALSVWIVKYGLPLPLDLPVITRDTDFLTQSSAAKASVEKFARAINGKASFPRRLALTALVGQVELDVSDETYINVDVIFKIIGLDPAKVLARAVRVELSGATTFLVMHPFDLLKSRLANLHELRDKQNDKGAAQLRLAIDVARAYLREQAARYAPAETGAGRSPIQTLVSEIEKLAIDDAGRKVAKRWGVHVADAIDPSLIPAGVFWVRKWPALRGLMSAEYAGGFTAPLTAPPATKKNRQRSP